VVIPVLVTVVQAIQGGFSAAGTALGSQSTLTLVLHSVEVAAAATPICAVIGVAAGWFVERTRLPGRRLARPGLVAALVLVFAFTLGDLSTTQVLLPVNLYTLGTEFNANSSTVAFAAPFAGVLIALALVAAYLLMSRFGRVRTLSAR
jgi:ABC-type Fe3+ transport system permease subunit